MDDFDELCGVLDDLADFDVNSFTAPTPSQPSQPSPVINQPPVTDNLFQADELDFGMDFAPPEASTPVQPQQQQQQKQNEAFTFDTDDLDLGLDDIIDDLNFDLEPGK